MIPSGRGEYEPVASNDTPEGRKKNRRIEIMLIDKSLMSEMTKTGNDRSGVSMTRERLSILLPFW